MWAPGHQVRLIALSVASWWEQQWRPPALVMAVASQGVGALTSQTQVTDLAVQAHMQVWSGVCSQVHMYTWMQSVSDLLAAGSGETACNTVLPDSGSLLLNMGAHGMLEYPRTTLQIYLYLLLCKLPGLRRVSPPRGGGVVWDRLTVKGFIMEPPHFSNCCPLSTLIVASCSQALQPWRPRWLFQIAADIFQHS